MKGAGKKTGTASSALKLAGPSWPFVLGTSPVPRAPTPSEEGKGPKNAPTLPGQSAPKVTPPYFCFRLFHCQSIKGSHTKSFKVRKAQGQVQS